MKNLIIKILGIWLILYLLGAFSEASFNIASWNVVTRGTIATLMGIGSLMAAIPEISIEFDGPK